MSRLKQVREFTGEKALDFWLDVFEPMIRIVNDPIVVEWRNSNSDELMASVIAKVIRQHRDCVWQILATFKGTTPQVCKKQTNAVDLLQDIIAIMQMEGFADFFGFPTQTSTSSGDATENTEVEEQLSISSDI